MGTSAVVGADIGFGLRGCLVTYDAEPDIMLPALSAIVSADGFSTARLTLLSHEWVFVDETTTIDYIATGGAAAIPGYGVPVDVRTDLPSGDSQPAHPTWWSPVDLVDGHVDAAFGFYLHPDATVTVHDRGAGTIIRTRLP